MSLFFLLSNLLCLLLPAFTFAHVTTPEDSINLAATNIKRLSNPLRNLLHKRDDSLFAAGSNASSGLALNSTNDSVDVTIPFQNQINIPGQGRQVYFLVKGEVDDDYSATVELWYDYHFDRRIGVYHGYLLPGVDMKLVDMSNIISGEARLYVVQSGEWIVLVFEAYGSVHLPSSPAKDFAPFAKAIKRWKMGYLNTMQDIPNDSGAQTLSNVTVMDTAVSTE